MQRSVNLPVGPHPGWELEEDSISGESQLKTIPESHVVLQSLRQSRNKWIFSTFPKFSAKARGGKPAEVVPPPHSVKAHGRYDMKIACHTFPNTAFYEVHYISQLPLAFQPPGYIVPAQSAYVGATMSTQSPASSASTIEQQNMASIPVSDPAHVTPGLILQVNAASLSNPTLANLLRLAATGSATPDQLQTLALLIQSLGAMQPANVADPPHNPTPPIPQFGPSPSVKEFDMVIEFQERPSDRWIIPRGPVVCERVDSADASGTFDVLLSMSLPFPKLISPGESDSSADKTDAPPHVVTFRLLSPSESLWGILVAWAGGTEGIERSRKILNDLMKAPKRVYLQHQLSDDLLLSQIQAALAPPYSTKSIVPGNADGTKSKRKTVSRKAANKSTDSRPAVPEQGHTAKRRQTAKQKAPAALPLIACRACGQTDVPLMMGGRSERHPSSQHFDCWINAIHNDGSIDISWFIFGTSSSRTRSRRERQYGSSLLAPPLVANNPP
ncbi:hypothetical protein B0H21DRAFT_406627 [Amylocystis lapponica]|nr:hypothetical protein B0H21DRAFT_406627 [Amylocystis lapponica]